MERKPYLINQALKSYLAASILTIAVVQINSVVDSILMGHFINPDALAAITLSGPVMTIIISCYVLFAGGAALLAGKKIGERDYDHASKIFSVSMNSLVSAAVIVSAICVYFCNDIVALFCNNDRLLPYVSQYLQVGFICIIFSMLAQGLSQFTNVDGKPQKVTKAMTRCMVTNIIFDIILVALLKMGIRGSAIASALGYIVCIISLFPYTFGKGSSYKYKLLVPHAASILLENVKNGLAMLVLLVFGAGATFFMNSIILSSLGADGMFIMSIAGALIVIGGLFSSGASQAFVAIGGMLYGQKDYRGMRILFTRCLLIVISVSVTFTVLGLIKPDLFALLFGADSDALIADAQSGVRVIVLMLIPLLCINMMPAVYQVLGHLPLVGIVSMLYYVLLIPIMWFMSKTDTPSNIWCSYPIAGYSSLLLSIIIVTLYRRKQPKTQPLTLIPTLDADMDLLEISIPCSEDGVNSATDELQIYMSAHSQYSESSATYADAVKEVLQNIVMYSGLNDKSLVDVRAYCNDQQLDIAIKDNGIPFDPTQSEKQKNGLSQVVALVSKFEYKYMYKQNMTFMTFK